MATNFVEKNDKLPSFVALAFRNKIGHRYVINSVDDTSISCKFRELGPVTPELTELILCTFSTTRKKIIVATHISQDILDQFLQSFASALRGDHRSGPLFSDLSSIVAMEPRNQWMLGESNERWLITTSILCSFCTAFQKELHYHYLEALAFALTAEMMELHGVKIWWISGRYHQRWQNSFAYLCTSIGQKRPTHLDSSSCYSEISRSIEW